MALKIVTSKLPRLQLPERFKGTIVERWANYWKGLANDYKGKNCKNAKIYFTLFLFLFVDVANDSIKSMRERPLKFSIYGAIAAVVYGSCKTNPDYQDFLDQQKKSEQLVSLVTFDSHNPESVEYLKMLERSQNNDTLRTTSLGIFTIMWLHDNAKSLSTFEAKCDYLKPQWLTFHERIIDIGWWNKWWNLQRKLKNYDVNY